MIGDFGLRISDCLLFTTQRATRDAQPETKAGIKAIAGGIAAIK